MIQLTLILQQLKQLFFQVTAIQAETISPLAESGSARKYYRLTANNQSFIGVYNTTIKENEAYFSFTETFRQFGLRVPEIIAISKKKECYLLMDLGDSSLFDYTQKALKNDGYSAELIGYYKEAIDQLIRFQIDTPDLIDYSKAWPVAAFDLKSIFEDLNYFKYYFLRLHPVITVNEALLDEEFQRFAKFVSDAPADFFMYRDFQSRNILIKDNRTWFIDFQGGRKGPLQYDLVSLLYQVKAQMPQHIRNELIAYYLRMISKRLDVGALKFESYLPSFVLLRLLQVLGAYGFRGIIQRKNHFLQSIPFALNEMEQLLTFDSLFEPYPELKSVLKQMLQLKTEYQLPESTEDKKLTIRLSSFSYKKGGIPPDQSGNGGGFVFDCRFLPNPGREQQYKMLTGLDKEVIAYLEKEKSLKDFLNDTQKIINEAVGTYQNRGFSNLMISFGCTGGQHRSVYCAEKTAQWLQAKFPQVNLIVQHHEQKKI